MRERKMEPFGIERWFTKYETSVDINIAESGIQPFTLSEILEMSDEDFLKTKLGYIESGGSRELRELASMTYKEKNWENILVTTGGLEANFLIYSVLVQEGDEIIVEFPNYQQLHSVPRFFGAKIIPWKLREENSYKPDLKELNELISPRTKMIVINHPHNPTGSIIDNKTLGKICEIAQDNGSYLLSDEVYLDLKPEGYDLDAACDISSKAISVQSLSKSYGLPGSRIGWIAASKDVIERCNEFREYVTLCSNVLGEKLAIIALKNRKKVMERNKSIIKRNFEIVKKWIKKHDELSWVIPRAGVVAFPRYNFFFESIELCRRLAEEERVLIIPGRLFGDQDTEYHFRLGFGYETEKLEKGLIIIDRFFERIE
ncbi:MAG: aminotransferase class I/II-fold pyridoxal phosphate-dependent enzyme [Candidatus Jordarchaeum sp.]|uniref:aminotransferase class I/II-fold pyridoxal phosphate-dependent enzyme n=1 Tax=Candidatus Jordarchaeum sp. TaxID=2823881 RepID=UPI004049A7BF